MQHNDASLTAFVMKITSKFTKNLFVLKTARI